MPSWRCVRDDDDGDGDNENNINARARTFHVNERRFQYSRLQQRAYYARVGRTYYNICTCDGVRCRRVEMVYTTLYGVCKAVYTRTNPTLHIYNDVLSRSLHHLPSSHIIIPPRPAPPYILLPLLLLLPLPEQSRTRCSRTFIIIYVCASELY